MIQSTRLCNETPLKTLNIKAWWSFTDMTRGWYPLIQWRHRIRSSVEAQELCVLDLLRPHLLCLFIWLFLCGDSLVAQMVKSLPAMWETRVWSLGGGRYPEEGNGNPLQCSCLGKNRLQSWQATVHGVTKNWTQLSDFTYTVVLGKTLESSLDSKEIKPINLKGNQPWIFIVRTDAKAPIFWPPDVKSQLIGEDSDAGTD